MSNVQNRRLPKPTEEDHREVQGILRRVQRGDLKPPQERLREQLTEIFAKWDRLLGDDWGASADAEFKAGRDPKVP